MAKSCRRIYFNHLYESVEERGHFHVDQMYGSGSGILVRYNETYFLLTARHVIKNNIPGDFQNESPFWITGKFQGGWSSIYDFMFPKRIWDIGGLIKKDLAYIDSGDVCLIELFDPFPFHQPDHFVQIYNTDSILGDNYFDGQVLLVVGYPFELNEFDFTTVGEYSHSTKSHRLTIPGVYKAEKPFGHISFELTSADVQHKSVTGMSGGVVCNVQPKGNLVKLAGMAISAGDNICRFVPSYIFINALLNYQKSMSKIVDPIVTKEISFDEKLNVFMNYLAEFHKAA